MRALGVASAASSYAVLAPVAEGGGDSVEKLLDRFMGVQFDEPTLRGRGSCTASLRALRSSVSPTDFERPPRQL